ncbi:hypothetical protein SARC_02401 [Sphaeroforma arctica JP610]|uniref:Uncharacterized protein n=1 Tax=Sphaeroforma arctica JP610 TaxID=667725 RepID=A0A0L0G8N8_9EUKA|nr:hypothetical protein SARC_02401 [Sphaeroforma arctica JP610]KNC85402.1 hypothetical protein SARC_02401 [Sphaeroforma arctica JP610]|eukprot:XP_014159304.1 hypothetical protein SARC_02401 [Sphaeroforma arctica JP610]
MAQRNVDIFQNLPAVEEDSGYTSSDASATIPSLMSNSGSEAEETPRPNDQHVRWDQQRESEVNNRRFRLNRISMARQLERFRLPRQVPNFTWTSRTEAGINTTTEPKEPKIEPKEQPKKKKASEVQERNEQDQKGQMAKPRVQPDDQLSRNDCEE